MCRQQVPWCGLHLLDVHDRHKLKKAQSRFCRMFLLTCDNLGDKMLQAMPGCTIVAGSLQTAEWLPPGTSTRCCSQSLLTDTASNCCWMRYSCCCRLSLVKQLCASRHSIANAVYASIHTAAGMSGLCQIIEGHLYFAAVLCWTQPAIE